MEKDKRIPLESISLDESGKVVISNPEFYKAVKEAVDKSKASGGPDPQGLNILCGCNVPCL
ncbi:hypothetical protein CDO28_34720 (plasmid) [Sinorhizobium meliloti]|nr:hypothetical protein CDO28_34720 [Sinorhizobium meliloti]